MLDPFVSSSNPLTHIKTYWLWLLVAAILTISSFWHAETHTVVEIYLFAARQWTQHLSPYTIVDYFIYPPFSALLFTPLLSLPLPISLCITRLLLLGLLYFSTNRFSKALFNQRGFFLLCSLLLLLFGFNTLETGQFNILLVCTCMLSLAWLHQARWLLCGAILGVVLGIKPTLLPWAGVVCVLYPRTLLPCLLGLAFTLIVPFVFADHTYVISTYHDFFHMMHNISHSSINEHSRWAQVYNLLNLVGFPLSYQSASMVSAVAGIITLCLGWWGKKTLRAYPTLLWLLVVITSYMMLFNFKNEGNTFVIFAPAVALAIWIAYQKQHWRYLALFIAIAIGIFGNYYFSKGLIAGQTCWFAPFVTLFYVILGWPYLYRRLRSFSS